MTDSRKERHKALAGKMLGKFVCVVCRCEMAANKAHPDHPETCLPCVEFAADRSAGGDPFEEAA